MKKSGVLCLILLLALCLSACGITVTIYRPGTRPTETDPPGTEHVHRLMDGRVVRPLSCTTDEKSVGVCSCGALLELTTRTAPGSHQFENGVCTACGGQLGTDLEYSIDASGTTCTVTGAGSCQAAILVIPDSFEGLPVTAIGPAAFFGQKDLVTVELPEGITSIGHAAFSDTLVLENVFLPDSLEQIDTLAFSECRSLRQLYLPAGVRVLGENALLSHGVLERIDVATENMVFSSQDGVLFSKDGQVLLCYPSARTAESYVVPDGVRSIADHAFQRNGILRHVTLPVTLEQIGSHGFFMCSYLEEIEIPAAVRRIGDSAFSDCHRLQRITFREGLQELGSSAFHSCFQLQEVVLPASLTKMGGFVFTYCSTLRHLSLGAGLTTLPESLCAMSTELRTVNIPDSITSIGANAFLECQALETLHFAGTRAQWQALPKESGWDANTGEYLLHCADDEEV